MNVETSPTKAPPDPYQFAVKAALFVYVFAFLVFGFYIWHFRKQALSDDSGNWGEFGDFMGGVINPVVGIVTVFLIVINIRLQRDELRASLKELKKSNENNTIQSFEQSLFSWLSNYHTLLASITHNTDEGTGRTALSAMYLSEFSGVAAMASHYKHEYGHWVGTSDAELHLSDMRDSVRQASQEAIEELQEVFSFSLNGYQKNFKKYRTELGPLLRTQFRLIQWIDSSAHLNTVKWHYVALVRAQLSWIELCVLFYSALTPAGERFVPLINKYALFDNLDEGADTLIDTAVEHFCSSASEPLFTLESERREWPFKHSAFSSALARRALGVPPPQS